MAPTSNDTLAKAINRLADVHEKQLGLIADAVKSLSHQVRQLGNADAATTMGGLEGLGRSIVEAAQTVANAVEREPCDD